MEHQIVRDLREGPNRIAHHIGQENPSEFEGVSGEPGPVPGSWVPQSGVDTAISRFI